ncbi:uncharacterized protein [Periplaneta americana]|uniref:uncharacterized protein isoform X2 n=1 Tax=Periplaneta americana TaxID=6978 RepID=UPI0037E7E1FC
MSGARVSLLMLILASLHGDLEAADDTSCYIGAPPIENFSLSVMSNNLQYYTVLTNSKTFSDRFCFLIDSFRLNYATAGFIAYRPTGNKYVLRKRAKIVERKYENNILTMIYQEVDLNVFSSNYTVLAADYATYAIIGACLDNFEKPFIRVLANKRDMTNEMEDLLRTRLRNIGLDDSEFMRTNSRLCNL